MSDPTTVESEIETAELSLIIEDFLETLTVQNRAVFMRRYWFSDSCKEIAKRMGLIEKNVTVRQAGYFGYQRSCMALFDIKRNIQFQLGYFYRKM